MAIKRKLSDINHSQDVSNVSIKRNGFGWRVSERNQHGQDLARKGKFAEAIQVFTAALSQKNVNTLNIMDSRSAVYCRMGLYDKALGDAKHMIRADSQDERGYLRAGKALLLAQKPEKALDIYAYALKSLDQNHPRRETVVKVHTKLSVKMSAQYRDPVQSLNNDCLLEIFQHVPFRQIVAATRVSKTWGAYIKSQPSLWSNISFKDSRTAATAQNLRACIYSSGNRVKSLQLHNMSNPLNAIQQASRCPLLEHLDVDGSVEEHHIYDLFHKKQSLKAITLSDKIPISRDTLLKLMGKLSNLERVEVNALHVAETGKNLNIGRLSNLKSLTLDIKGKFRPTRLQPYFFIPVWIPEAVPSIHDLMDVVVWNYSDRVPKLEELNLSAKNDQSIMPITICIDNIRHCNLRKVDISYMTLFGNWGWSPNIEHLRLSHCSRNCIDNGQDLMLPNLKSLVLSNLDFLNIGNVVNLLHHNNGSLETLQIELCDLFNSSDLPVLAELTDAIKNVKTLHLNGMGLYNLSDAVLIELIKNMPHLKELHVPYTGVTGSLIRKVVQWSDTPEMLPRIETLNMKGCADVSHEAVEWGRSNGLTIIKLFNPFNG